MPVDGNGVQALCRLTRITMTDVAGLSTQEATIASAVVAGLVALVVLVANALGQRAGETRAAHRKALEPFIAELGESIYSVLASARTWVQLRDTQAGALAKWEARFRKHKRRLATLRPRVRYTLWGLDEPLRVLIRVPDWLKHVRKDPERVRKIISAGTRLRAAVDQAIRTSYAKGKPPSWWRRTVAHHYARQARRAFDSGKQAMR